MTFDVDAILKVGLPTLALIGIGQFCAKKLWPFITDQWKSIWTELTIERKANNDALIRALAAMQHSMESMAAGMAEISETNKQLAKKIDRFGEKP